MGYDCVGRRGGLSAGGLQIQLSAGEVLSLLPPDLLKKVLDRLSRADLTRYACCSRACAQLIAEFAPAVSAVRVPRGEGPTHLSAENSASLPQERSLPISRLAEGMLAAS